MVENQDQSKKDHTANIITSTSGKRFFLAADTVQRTNEVTKTGGIQGLEPFSGNKFKLYEQIGDLNPHISIPLTKLALSLVKGIRFSSGDPKKNEDALIDDFKIWADQIEFRQKLQSMSRLLLKNGTYVAQVVETKLPTGTKTKATKGTGGTIMDFQPVLMKYTTLLPKGVKPGDKPETVIMPPIITAYINEGDEKLRQQIKEENLIYGALFSYDKPFVDVLGRETYGIYGTSLLDPIYDTFVRYLDLVKGYTEYIKKYGIGRYFFNYSVLEELLKEGDVDTVKKLIEELQTTIQYIQENEDIVGCGFDIKSLDQSGTNIDIVNFKNSLETDIQVGLLQQPLTMGRAEGTTYASGYVSEADRLIVLEGLQKLLQDIVNKQIIDKRLALLGKEAGTIKVIFEELSQPSIVFKDLLLAYEDGLLTRKEMRTRAGVQPEVSDADIMEGRDLVIKATAQAMSETAIPSDDSSDELPKSTEDRKIAKDEKTATTKPGPRTPSRGG